MPDAVVAVIDEHFLRSTWPLWELHQAVARLQDPGSTGQCVLLPVFWGIDPWAQTVEIFDSYWSAIQRKAAYVQQAAAYKTRVSQGGCAVPQDGEQPDRSTIAEWRLSIQEASTWAGVRFGGTHTQVSHVVTISSNRTMGCLSRHNTIVRPVPWR